MLGFASYAGSYNGYWPQSLDLKTPSKMDSSKGMTWGEAISSEMGMPFTWGSNSVYKNSMFYCPSSSLENGVQNVAMCYYQGGESQKYFLRTEQVLHPTSTALSIDAASYYAVYPSDINFCHGGSLIFTALYCDGHAGTLMRSMIQTFGDPLLGASSQPWNYAFWYWQK